MNRTMNAQITLDIKAHVTVVTLKGEFIWFDRFFLAQVSQQMTSQIGAFVKAFMARTASELLFFVMDFFVTFQFTFICAQKKKVRGVFF